MSYESRATASIIGLAVGDAFGSQFLLPGDHPAILGRRTPPGPWSWSDDTEMACSVYSVLDRYGRIDQDALAASFAGHMDPDRGYGSGVERRLLRLRAGEHWRDVAAQGGGSWGNGGAMRVAPLGAWLADDLGVVIDQAARSAEITHAHPDGIAGAVAVALAAALASTRLELGPAGLLDEVLRHLPAGEVRQRVRLARDLPGDTDVRDAAGRLGNGREVSALDTVPLSLWLAAWHLDAYADALWQAVRVAEDVDTVCAITGGIIAARTGSAAIPADWRAATEPFPGWADVR
ncbi:ADP-ribosylglycohydrolase family protein [Amycolatopsis suaedae]|uniref:ADP-ribosylglycohydrolase family protein n=1 Tax=Amycolatopsis suaedae TaxID=2510978 RepID=A0A4Q7J2X3_9PSEU|nr:ADP-ribosylglycohydrolase family protein [Amycolatopsis suaedae]RZQ60952.1 ADP-ribosylglycohydrolase family protein [Amycolatopsis suaedae]